MLLPQDKDNKKSKDYARCKGRPFPFFDDLAQLVEGHQATTKYFKTAIIDHKAPPQNRPPTPSTSTTKSAPTTTHTLSPTSSTSDLADQQRVIQGEDSSCLDHSPAANRHEKSAVALKQRAPVHKKKQTGVDIIDGL